MELNVPAVTTSKKPKKIQNTSILLRKQLVELQQDYIKYRTLYENLADLCLTTDTEGKILDCNESYAKHLGYTKKEVIGSTIFSHTSEKSLAAMMISFKTWKETGRGTNREVSLKRKDGTTFPVFVNPTNLFGLDGKIIGSNTVIRDISTLKKTERQFQSLYENSPDLYRTINTDGIILDCNKSYYEYLGYTKGEIIGKSIFEHTVDEGKKEMHDSIETWKKTGRMINREGYLKRKDGITFPVLIRANNLYDEDGKLIGSNTIIKDISSLKILNQVAKAKKELEEKDIQKEKFVAMLTHDLKNFLSPILLNCELLKDPEILGSLKSEQLDSVDEIDRCLKKMDRLVTDIHDVHRLDMKQMRFNKEPVNVNDLIHSITTSNIPLMREKKIKLVNDLPHEPLTIISDGDRIFQIFSNLIKNAKDFLPKENPKIKIGTIQHDTYIIFYVKDNGVGVPTEKQEKLFHEFFQVDEINKGVHIGSGLGLAICKGIAEGMGGRLWVESKEGVGTTFYFSIPKGGTKK